MKLTLLFPALWACVACSSTTDVVEAAEDPCLPREASSEELTVPVERGAIGGTVLIPQGCGPVPLVVIVSGSGLTDRDGNGQSQGVEPSVYRVLAEALRDRGVASFRYDEPGIGESRSAFPERTEDFRLEWEVDNEARIVAALRKDARFDSIVVAGHSQGSLVAILGAEKEPIDGFVSLAGAGRPIGDVIREQLTADLTPDERDELDEVIRALERGETVGPLEGRLAEVFPESSQPYMSSWMQYDPKQEIATLTVPTLLLQGRFDVQVSEADAALLLEGKPDAELVYVDDMNHMLRQVKSKAVITQRASYTEALPLHLDALDAISLFLEAR